MEDGEGGKVPLEASILLNLSHPAIVSVIGQLYTYIVEADLSGDITLFNQSSFPNKIIYSDLVPVGSSTCTQILQNKLN